ncbi:MAG: DNA topoisomerase I [Candidatus Doudnabacteria bacterium RIFCSPLOWO2_01_FULL_48_57]|nr:MAG: DNA topoisomerase I [Candidatus Doudnabacteria bacterium RIFCSPHIGHO2_01_48_18]OGE77183.1 MAG: DNA topoisomerase I [Candidatus Doudnabacteria bacterium RIFCSPHIGHO2_01_FULL_48_180]OGE91572.1 MAG: DNA topoisomerase I [Candidatus Doudnabacteria bacterium RIFCSPHIGHO2_12_FULL_47_25]OGE96565.1 MAG: DNA topoisomerase I [Candidatus Doudnabacteria bacterium RIFCSPLOWO2_01_FULL_48_57]
MSKLVIVESPTKAKTISKFLGKEFKIESSFGHIRDLPKSKMGIDIEKDFEPEYLIPRDKSKHVKELQALAKKADEVILATDEDREGEAIAWHLVHALKLDEKQAKRIVFHEITKTAIEKALENPRHIYLHLVDAQQARRVLDRLVGYELSPFLWTKVKYGLSAGRVQSVAMRLIVEREREIEKFKTQEYWTIEAKLSPNPPTGGKQHEIFGAKLHSIDGAALKKFDIPSKEQGDKIVADLKGAAYTVEEITKKEVKRSPAAPFTTSTLQQEAARKLGMSAKQTMTLAQKLYELGYITYMRTDSVNLAESALTQAQSVISKKYGKDYVGSTRRYKTKSKGAQEAHEGIRPTDLSVEAGNLEGEDLDAKHAKLYDLIWKRTLASQMPEAIFDQTSVDISTGAKYMFRASGQVMKFDGFIKAYMEDRDEDEETDELPEGHLPELSKNQWLALHELAGKQHFTEPPPRFTDASLVKALESYGIGRPSTYAPTISTILERGYVEKEEKKFKPTTIGLLVNDILVEHFPKIVDYEFTAKMEEYLDEIAEGKLKWQPVIKEFYAPFKENLEEKKTSVKKQVQQTNVPCPICGKHMVIKFGRFGQFMACVDYPECKGTKQLPEEEAAEKKIKEENKQIGGACPVCEHGHLVVKKGRFGFFIGCDKYPECKHIEKIEKKTGVKCPQCDRGDLIEKKARKGGRKFWGCNRYPDCEYATWKFPTADGSTEKTEEKKEAAEE